MLSKKQALEYLQPLQVMYLMKKGLPNVVIALNTKKGIVDSELEEFSIDNFRTDPLYPSVLYIRDAEYMEGPLKPDCYLLGTWANLNMIPVDKFPKNISVEEIIARRDEFSEVKEVYQVSMFTEDSMITITLEESKDGTLEIMYPPGISDAKDVNFVDDSTSDVVRLFKSIFELR